MEKPNLEENLRPRSFDPEPKYAHVKDKLEDRPADELMLP